MHKNWGVLLLALISTSAYAQCTKDTDCKGSRVCNEGMCVAPAPSDAPVAEPQLPPPEVRRATVIDSMRTTRIMQLEREVAELQIQLDDATLPGPIIKLVVGGVFAALSAMSFGLYADAYACNANNFRGCASTSTWITAGVTAGVAAAVFFIWGGTQLGLRLGERNSLPVEISNRQAELTMLRQAVQ